MSSYERHQMHTQTDRKIENYPLARLEHCSTNQFAIDCRESLGLRPNLTADVGPVINAFPKDFNVGVVHES